MNKVITIGREFGSGGRELGRRLAERLGFAYYDQEIVSEIAKRTSLAEQYIREVTDRQPAMSFPIHIGRSFYPPVNPAVDQSGAIFREQANILREMAEASDCVIVGRCGDYILRDLAPLRVFVYAAPESKLARCRRAASDQEALTDKELKKKIRDVDKNRAGYYGFYTGQTWGAPANYDICLNTTRLDLKDAAALLAAHCECFFP